jgi:hypothetical protein
MTSLSSRRSEVALIDGAIEPLAEGRDSKFSLAEVCRDVGWGIHLYRETEQAVPLKLQRTKVFRSGVLLNYLQPATAI